MTRKGWRPRLRSRDETGARTPGTIMAHFLRATMLRWEDQRLRLSAVLKSAGSDDDISVMENAFEIAVRRHFGEGLDRRQVSKFVANMRDAFGPEVPVLEADALIRSALGDNEVSISDIDGRARTGSTICTLMAIADFLDRDEKQVNAILLEAEAIAIGSGFQPTAVA